MSRLAKLLFCLFHLNPAIPASMALKQGQFCPPWDTWTYLETSLMVRPKGLKGNSSLVGEARGASEDPTIPRSVPHNKRLSGPRWQQYQGETLAHVKVCFITCPSESKLRDTFVALTLKQALCDLRVSRSLKQTPCDILN